MSKHILGLAAVLFLAVSLAGCSGGGRTALPPTAPAQPTGDDEQAVPPGSDAEGSHEEQAIALPPPPWETTPEGPTWTHPETGTVYYVSQISDRYVGILFKSDNWWIEEEYPVDENTPRWKIEWRAAVEELNSRGFYMNPITGSWDVPNDRKVFLATLPEGLTFFDAYDSLTSDFPCMEVGPYCGERWPLG